MRDSIFIRTVDRICKVCKGQWAYIGRWAGLIEASWLVVFLSTTLFVFDQLRIAGSLVSPLLSCVEFPVAMHDIIHLILVELLSQRDETRKSHLLIQVERFWGLLSFQSALAECKPILWPFIYHIQIHLT